MNPQPLTSTSAPADPAVLGRAVASARSALVPPGRLRRRLREPDLETLRGFVRLLDRVLADLNRGAGLGRERAELVRHSVLQASFPVLVCYRHERPGLALSLLLGQWQRLVEAFGGGRGEALETALKAAPGTSEDPDLAVDGAREHELLASFNTAVFEVLRESESRERGREILRRLMTHLELSFDDLGRLFGVSGETVRRWERGSHRIPAERMAQLTEAEGGLGRLLTIFLAERLAAALRRPAKLFDGETALDWILRGRISEVADRYEAALAYQA